MPIRPADTVDELYRRLGRRLHKSLLDQMVRSTDFRPTITAPKIMAFAIAGLVHGLTVGVAALGLLSIIGGWPNPILVVLGAILLMTAWLLRPERPGLSDVPLPPDQYPALYGFTAEVASALGTSNVDAIVVTEDFNAAFGQIGWARKRVLFLGLPYWSILDPPARVALIGHELAHGVNGDPTRTFFVGTAIDSLRRWYSLLYPGGIWSSDEGDGILSIPGNIIRGVMAGFVRVWLFLLANLVWRESQRAEYLADYLSAVVAGTDGTLSLLDKSSFGAAFGLAVQKVALNPMPTDLFTDLQSRVANAAERGSERTSASQNHEEAQIDTSHPPTAFRKVFLLAHPVPDGKVTLSQSEADRIDAELAPLKADIQDKLQDMYRDWLYY